MIVFHAETSRLSSYALQTKQKNVSHEFNEMATSFFIRFGKNPISCTIFAICCGKAKKYTKLTNMTQSYKMQIPQRTCARLLYSIGLVIKKHGDPQTMT